MLGHVQTLGGLIDVSVYYAASAIAGAASMYYFISLGGRTGELEKLWCRLEGWSICISNLWTQMSLQYCIPLMCCRS